VAAAFATMAKESRCPGQERVAERSENEI